MASHGAIAAATIGAVATIAATVLAVVLPKVLADPAPGSGSGSGTTVTTTTGGRIVGPTRTTTTTSPRRDEPAELFANKESAPVGATVLVSGRKFAGEESIDIRFGANPGVTTRSSKGGDFANVSIRVPDFFKGFAKPMTIEIVAVGKSSIKSARVAFTISG